MFKIMLIRTQKQYFLWYIAVIGCHGSCVYPGLLGISGFEMVVINGGIDVFLVA